jgi:hypothetical protein
VIAPPTTATPRLGPLAAPSEKDADAAYPGLRDTALTLPWAAVALGVDVTRLEALARAGELLVVPGPWSMRQAHRSGLGYFLPAWQLGPDGCAAPTRHSPNCWALPPPQAGQASTSTAS